MNTFKTPDKAGRTPRAWLRRMVSCFRDWGTDQGGSEGLTGKVVATLKYDPKTGALTKQPIKLRTRVFFAWYDLWVGVFFDQKKKQLYICPLPCLVFQIGYG